MFTYQPYTLSEWTIQYSWRYARHDQSNRVIRTRAVSVEWRYVRYESITYHTNYIAYPPVPSVRNVLLGSLSNPKNCHLGIKVAESAIPHRIFWLLWKMAYTLTRETEMTVAGMRLFLCATAAPLKLKKKKKERKKKREEVARRRVQVKRRKKVKDWLKRRVQLGHNRTLLYELEEGDIASFKNYLRIDPDTFNEILERITSRIKKLTTNIKKPIPVRLRLAATLRFLATGNSSKCISYFRVSYNIACELFIEVCQAIIDEYADLVRAWNFASFLLD